MKLLFQQPKHLFWIALALSGLGHGLAMGIFFHDDAQEFLNRSPVSVRLMPAAKAKKAPRAAAKPHKPKPAPRAEKAPPEPTPVPVEESPVSASTLEERPGTPSDQDLLGSGMVGGVARDAALIASSFINPPYTRAALQAQYETTVTAEILVSLVGRAEEVKFSAPVLHGMEERLVRSIKNARFDPARNNKGDQVRGWTRIKFVLNIP